MHLKKAITFIIAFIMAFSHTVPMSHASSDTLLVGDVAFYMVNDGEKRHIESLTDAKEVSASLKIKNISGLAQQVTMFLAYYSEPGVLENVDSCQKTLYPGRQEELEVLVAINGVVTEESEVKAFVWDSEQNPYSAAKTLQGRNVYKRIYVSPYGNDENSGTIESPFATIARARDEVRKYNADMTGDINVYLREGTYRLGDTLTFTPSDSGANGYRVNYMSYPGEDAAITGSTPVTGWTPAGDGMWCAEVSGIEGAAQLYVDGSRAKRASSEVQYSVEEVFDNTDDTYYDKDGITVTDEKLSSYLCQEDIQLHFARGWRSYLLNVNKIEAQDGYSKIYLSHPGFGNVYKKSPYYTIGQGHTFYLENALEELDTPGEFYYKKDSSVLYYMPLENQNMNEAVCELAVLDTLIDIRGEDSDNKVKNISFSSLEFAHGSWSRATEAGHVSDQAQDMAWDSSTNIRNPGYTMVPSNISVTRADAITFTDNIIRDMGAVGIGLYQGVSNSSVTGNTFCDLGDSAVTVGMPDSAYEEEVCTGRNLVADKWISVSGSLGNYTAEKAVDSNYKTGWSSQESGAAWWQVDLGSSYEIDRVDIADRADMDADSTEGKSFRTLIRKNIEIYGSNDPEFAQYTVLYSNVNGDGWPDDEAVSYPIEDSGKYRYVRIAKSGYLYLADVRIINEDIPYSPVNEICKSNLISNNYITRAGLTNYGAPGIQAYFTQNTQISNNHLYDLPYSGICVGWGWTNYTDSVVCRDNKILNNRIEKTLQVNFDGGAIYTLGSQPGSVISGNYVSGALHVNGGIYLDNGTQYYTVTDNAVEDVPHPFVASGYTYNNLWQNNFSSVTSYKNALVIDSTSSFEEPEYFIPGSYPDEVQTIIDNAGPSYPWSSVALMADDNLWQKTDEALWGNVLNDINNSHFTDEQFRRGYLERYSESAVNWLSMAEGTDSYLQSDIDALAQAVETAQEFIAEDKLNPKGRYSILQARSALVEAMDKFVESKRGVYDGLPAQTVEVNVAQYKPVSIGSGTENASYPSSNMTDGNRYTFADSTYTNQITVDLMRRYNVKRIELYSRHDYGSEAWCSNFKVYGSNDADFVDKTELENYGAYNADVFPVKGSYSFDVDSPEAYRYIRLEYPAGTTWLPYGDIRVFADVEVTQVTNKNMAVTTAPVSTTYPGIHLIDENNSTFVYPGYNNGYPFFSIDLGRAYPIGMIEMDSRTSGDDGYIVQYGITAYGSNSLMDNDTNVSKSKLTEDDGYTALTWIQHQNRSPDYMNNPDMQFKRYAVTGQYPSYREVFSDEASYRYLTVKDDEQQSLQASELRAYVINPMVTGIRVDGSTVTVCFSDQMMESFMTKENIVLKNETSELSIRDLALSDDGYEFSFNADLESSGEYTVQISKKVRNKNEVTMQNDKSITFTTP